MAQWAASKSHSPELMSERVNDHMITSLSPLVPITFDNQRPKSRISLLFLIVKEIDQKKSRTKKNKKKVCSNCRVNIFNKTSQFPTYILQDYVAP